jgi:TRAP-type C4-dicarboxylate transport system permease small subunit
MIILSALVAQTGWQWMTERGSALLAVPWPRPSLAGVSALAFWIAGLLVAAAVLRYVAKRLALGAPATTAAAPLPQRGAAD